MNKIEQTITTNVGQQTRLSMSRIREHCNLTPYIRLVNEQKNENGYVTVNAVNEHTRLADISNYPFLGGVWVPLEALIF